MRAATAAAGALLWCAAAASAWAQGADPVDRGAYIFAAAGCASCHTDRAGGGAPLAGGRALKTPFGVFYAPNITPHPEHGIGRWSEADMVRALHEGQAPDGSHYFPSFPYASYTGLRDADIRDMWAYMQTVPAAATPNRPHELSPPFSWRFLVGGWKLLFFKPERFAEDPAQSEAWSRGAYLVRAVTHCGECHTPRNALGGSRTEWYLAGSPDGADNEAVPNITPHESGIAEWSADDIATYLDFGMDPGGDFAGGAMGEVIEHATAKLTDEDRAAIAEYLISIPAKESQARK